MSARVMLFVNSQVRGGVEEVVLSLALGLARQGYAIHLAAPAALLAGFARELEGSRIRQLAVSFSSWRQVNELRRFAAYLRQQRIALVNSHLFRSTFFAAPLARLAGVPVVIETTHGPEAWRRGWFKRSGIVDRWIERLVTANIAVSEANRRYLVEQKRYPAHKIHVVPNGRDLARFAPPAESELRALRDRFGIAAHDRVLLAVGRLEPQKDPECLLEAFTRVTAEFPAARLLVAGDGSLRPHLEELAARNGLAGKVIFAGFQPNAAAIYHIAEMVVLTSRYEGMPLVAIEAGAAGRPIVATAVDGTVEVVEHGRTGWLVPPRNPAAAAEAACRLLADPEQALRMGQAARQRIQRHFSFERQLADTIAIFENYLGRHGRRQAA